MSVKKMSRLLAGVLVLAMCLGMLMTACKRQNGPDSTETKASADYTIEVITGSGMALENIGIYIYTDDTLAELVWFAKTDAQGIVRFTDAASDSYVAVLSGVPDGYPAEEMYPLTGETTRIVLGAEMLEVDDLEGITLKLGDMFIDYTFTDAEGTEYSISQLLQEKKAVVLNFWYVECAPCKMEFPYLQEAYEKYSDTIEVLALNPVNTDPEAVAAFQKEQELTFPMMLCDDQWGQVMELTAYPTTVVIDRFGCITMIHKGSITESALFERIFNFYGAEDYVQTITEAVEDLPETEEEREARTIGTAENPYEFSGVTSYKVTVAPDEEVYMNIYKISQMYVQIRDADAYVKYKNKTYTPSGGVVGLTITSDSMTTPVSLVVGNNSDEEKTFTLNFSLFAGTMGNPYTMSLGEFNASVAAGNEQGVYYNYKVTEDGILSVKCLKATSGIDYDFTLYNLNTYALRNYQSEGAKSEDGYRMVSVKVRAGDTVQFSAAAMPDSTGTYPAAAFTFEAYMGEGTGEDDEEVVEKIVYAVTLTDENRNPISNTQVYLTQADGSTLTLTTNESGVAATKLEPGTYPAIIKIPAGYKARITEFTLTEAAPAISVKLDTDQVVMKTYTLKILDESGAAVSGVLVSVGDSFGYTDVNGSISFTLPEGEYTAVIGAPDGFHLEQNSIPFGNGTELQVTLKAGGSTDPDSGTLTYRVKVTDYSGKAITNATVTFLREGNSAGISKVDSTGTAAIQLEKGSYTVSLAFDSGAYWYDASGIVLTESAPSATVVAVAKQSGEYTGSYAGELYHVTEGATYAQLQSGVTNYFIFTPEAAGLYRFTTTDSKAVISYWGASQFFITDMTSGTDYADNAFTQNIKEKNLGTSCIIGVTGTEECVLVITRIGDPILDETDIVPTVYEAKTPPKPFTLSLPAGKSLTYVDLTGKTADYNLVLGSDGYYHLNSVNGPVMYVNLSSSAPYISMYAMLGVSGVGGTNFTKTFYDDNGAALYREDYVQCMIEYIECVDKTYGVYPLTEDLAYMLQNGGEYKGWWDTESPNFVFTEVSGMNPELGWMFACCYIQ